MALRWYIVNTYSGYEERARLSLTDRIQKSKQEDLFGEILVPTEQVVEMVKGAKKTSARKFFPGYILVHVELNGDTWHTITGTPKISGFIGNEQFPDPLPEEEAAKIINRVKDGALKPKPKVSYDVGDPVRVTDGPFASFQGVVEEVFPDKGRVKVMVSIFGRETPVELEYIQVTRG